MPVVPPQLVLCARHPLQDNPFHVARSGAGGSGAKGKGKKK